MSGLVSAKQRKILISCNIQTVWTQNINATHPSRGKSKFKALLGSSRVLKAALAFTDENLVCTKDGFWFLHVHVFSTRKQNRQVYRWKITLIYNWSGKPLQEFQAGLYESTLGSWTGKNLNESLAYVLPGMVNYFLRMPEFLWKMDFSCSFPSIC